MIFDHLVKIDMLYVSENVLVIMIGIIDCHLNFAKKHVKRWGWEGGARARVLEIN